MVDELIDIFDENNNPTAKTTMKSIAHEKGLWHRTVHVWIYNKKGEILLQLRAKDKVFYPSRWDISAAGHISASEDYYTGALREVEEELGIKVEKNQLEFLEIRKIKSKYNNIINNEHGYVFLMRFDGDVEDINIQQEELDDVRFIGTDELITEIRNNHENFIIIGDYWFEMIDRIKEKTKKNT